MSDKFKQTVAVAPEFTSGEQPPAAKFTAIAAQMRRVARELEKAVGDIHDESWPYGAANTSRHTAVWGKDATTGADLGTDERPLSTVSLGRLMGPSSNLNPRMIGSNSVTDAVPVGAHEFSLRYPPSGGTVTFSDAAVFITEVALTALAAAGDYHVTAGGKVYCVTASNGGTAIYTADPSEWGGGQSYAGATFNVIPDPNQTQAGLYAVSVGAVDGSGDYLVELPLCQAQQSNIDGDSVTLDAYDVNYDVALELPAWMTGNYVAGDALPEGCIYLRNDTTNTVYKDATYKYVTASSFKISGVDLDDERLTDQFSVLTVGTDVTTSIDDLRIKQYHSHDRSYGEPYVPVDALVEVLAEAGLSGVYVPSEMPGNFAPQYLHRDGYHAGEDSGNNNDSNIMRGHLVLGKSGGAPGTYRTHISDTFAVYFGNPVVNGTPYIYATASGDLEVDSIDPTTGDINLRKVTNFTKKIVVNSGIEGLYTDTPALTGPLYEQLYPYCVIGHTDILSDLPVALSLDFSAILTDGTVGSISVMASASATGVFYPVVPGGTWDGEVGWNASTRFLNITPTTGSGTWPASTGTTDTYLKITLWYYR